MRGLPRATDGYALWSEGSGALALLAHSFNVVPGVAAGMKYGSYFSTPVLNDFGQVAFSASLSVTGGLDGYGVFLQRSGQITLLAREGAQATGLSRGTIYESGIGFPPALNNASQAAFTATFWLRATGDYGAGIWYQDSGSLSLFVRTGDPAPDTSGGEVFVSPNPYRPFDYLVLNDAGQTAIRTRLSGSGVDNSNFSGIWLGTPGDLHLVVRAGDHAPGTPADVDFAYFTGEYTSPAINSDGHIAFFASLTGTGINSTNNRGIWSDGSGSLSLVARLGDPAPGAPAGFKFSEFAGAKNGPILNDAGQTAFSASSTDGITIGWGVWSYQSGILAAVAFRGDEAPETPDGVTFAGFNSASVVLNDAGQVAFAATLMGTGVNATNDVGIWATDPNGALKLIVREGDLLEVAPGDLRTVNSLDFVGGTGNGDGRPSGFNNLGQLAFHAVFTDNAEGVFVSNVVAIPEPHALLLVSSGLLAMTAFRGRFSRTVPLTRIG